MQQSFILSFLIILFTSCNSGTIQQTVEDYHRRGEFNGAILITRNDSILIDTAFGFRNFYPKKPIGKQTSFYIASLAKSITALAVMQLNTKQVLKYDDPVSRYLTDIPAYAKDVTIRQLLNHTSGIPDYEKQMGVVNGLTNQQVLNWLNTCTGLNFTPGSKFEYSNSGYILLSRLIEKVSTQSYATYLTQHIFDPAGMYKTVVYDQTKPTIPDRAIGYNKAGERDDYSINTTGDGGIFSTTHDLLRWQQYLLHNALPDTTLRPAFQPVVLPDGSISYYGFGWEISNENGSKIITHTGGLNGFRSVIRIDRKNNTVIIALTNKGDAFPLRIFLKDIAAKL